MLAVQALARTSHVTDWLANSGSRRILHVFDRSCNLIDECREVVSLVTPEIGKGPFNLVLKDDICFLDHIHLESPVSSSLTHLSIGDLTIDMEGAEFWSPRPDWGNIQGKRDRILHNMTILQTRPFPQVQGALYPYFSALTSAVAHQDLPSSLAATRKLAGLGAGLTPAGDDMILGSIYAAWIIHMSDTAASLVRNIADTAAPLTTSLSAAWLRSAARGEAGILWHEFFEALVSARMDGIQGTLENILAVGETSGADAWAGFAGTVISWMGERGLVNGS